MSFLASLLIPLLKWLLESGGHALYDYVNRKISEHEEEKRNKENVEAHKKAVQNQDEELRKKTGRKLINGE